MRLFALCVVAFAVTLWIGLRWPWTGKLLLIAIVTAILDSMFHGKHHRRRR